MIAAVTAIKPFPISARRPVPAAITRPVYVDKSGPERYTGSHVQSAETIEKMRVAGRIAHHAMMEAAAHVAPGVTTDELDAVAHELNDRPGKRLEFQTPNEIIRSVLLR